MKKVITLIIFSLCFIGCNNAEKRIAYKATQENGIECAEGGCQGTYEGAEFIKGSDIAHQFSK